MKIIHINNSQNIRRLIFPDNQPHIQVENIAEGDDVTVICSITDTILLLQLLQTANALDNLFAKKKQLIIPWLMGARYDRLMQPGDSIDLQVIAQLINSMQFEKVLLFDVHADVTTLLINNSINISNRQLVEQYQQQDAVLICPDAGAAKKINKYLEWNSNLKEVVYCNKSRHLRTGRISLQVLEPEKCKNRNCAIIDDICDGGGTFLAIAQQIQPAHATLIVTHGIFSKGFTELEKHFHEIIVSDSYQQNNNSKKVKTLKIDYANFQSA